MLVALRIECVLDGEGLDSADALVIVLEGEWTGGAGGLEGSQALCELYTLEVVDGSGEESPEHAEEQQPP